MSIHLPTLFWACAMTTGLLAAAMAIFGATQLTYRGYWWWTSAQGLLAAGLASQALCAADPRWAPLAAVLMLPWPVALLAGMRRFFSRTPLALPPAADWLALLLAIGIPTTAWLGGGPALTDAGLAPGAAATAALAASAVHLYAAWLLYLMHRGVPAPALSALAGVLAWVSAVESARGAAMLGGVLSAEATAAIAIAGAAVMPAALALLCTGLVLTHQRTESRLRESQRKLRVLADIDMLTQLPNRRHFHELSAATLAADADAGCMMMFDVDHFKQVNDLLGHANGDEALRQVALAVRETLRARDVAGRLGGDEFAALLPQTSLSDAMSVAGRIVDRLEYRQVAPRVARLTLSFGVVQLQPGEDVDTALRRADQALYEAKRQGRSRAVVATGEEDKPVFGESRPMGLGSPHI